jgi:hypothetical protein
MKKSYIEPTINVVFVEVQNALLDVSKLEVGSKMSSGEADSRKSTGWDDEE